MKVSEIQVKIQCAEREAHYWREILRKKSCADCINWYDSGCKLANGERPPPEVEKVGCPAWAWDEIPF
jgi:hypothetical protein